MSNVILTGSSDEHIAFNVLEKPVHKLLIQPMSELQSAAENAGFQLKIASGFRNFQRQLAIWNGKARGSRVVLDDVGQPLKTSYLSKTQLVFAILRWSALPGTSRHHWGTDVDIYDANEISIESLQLVSSEYQGGGPCSALYRWLKSFLPNDDFYWPYAIDRGGVAPEPWHLSYRPLSAKFEQQLNLEVVEEAIRASEIELKQEILQNLETIFSKYIEHVSDI